MIYLQIVQNHEALIRESFSRAIDAMRSSTDERTAYRIFCNRDLIYTIPESIIGVCFDDADDHDDVTEFLNNIFDDEAAKVGFKTEL